MEGQACLTRNRLQKFASILRVPPHGSWARILQWRSNVPYFTALGKSLSHRLRRDGLRDSQPIPPARRMERRQPIDGGVAPDPHIPYHLGPMMRCNASDRHPSSLGQPAQGLALVRSPTAPLGSDPHG